MRSFWQLLGRAALSNGALRELYDSRRATLPEGGNRTRINLGVSAVLLATLVGFIFTVGRHRQDVPDFLTHHAGIVVLATDDLAWSFGALPSAVAASCSAGDASLGCFGAPSSWSAALAPQASLDAVTLTSRFAALHLTLTTSKLGALASANPSLLVSLPAFDFHRAAVFVGGERFATLFDRQRLRLAVASPQLKSGAPVDVDVLFELEPGQKRLVAVGDPEPIFVATHLGLRDFVEWRSAEAAGRGDYAGVMARIVMAVFILVMFLFVDGSLESLGLALFLGFEAFALSLTYAWLPVRNSGFLMHYAFQMGDIFRMFFFLQLARVIGRCTGRWLFWGSVLSVPYGLARHYELSLSMPWLGQIPVWRDLVIGLAGAFVCARAAASIRGQRLAWRQAALILAAIASLQQTLDPLHNLYPVLYATSWYVTLENFLSPTAVYLLALSAFINISTLENRVATLSAETARNQEIQQEMELGRTVQRAFLDVPALPPSVAVACHHEAASYVSGDTFYVHWDEESARLMFLVSDVTGHGVQAALKAAAGSAIASGIWRRSTSDGDVVALGARLASYDRALQEFLGRLSDEPDLTAMIGAEVDVVSGVAALYRANMIFPVVITPALAGAPADEPVLGARWSVALLGLANQALTTTTLTPGSLILMMSDGYVAGSRDLSALVHYLRRALSERTAPLDAPALLGLVQEFPGFHGVTVADDRTLFVFQWTRPHLAKASTGRDVA